MSILEPLILPNPATKDANQEICDAMRSDRAKLPQAIFRERPKPQTEDHPTWRRPVLQCV